MNERWGLAGLWRQAIGPGSTARKSGIPPHSLMWMSRPPSPPCFHMKVPPEGRRSSIPNLEQARVSLTRLDQVPRVFTVRKLFQAVNLLQGVRPILAVQFPRILGNWTAKKGVVPYSLDGVPRSITTTAGVDKDRSTVPSTARERITSAIPLNMGITSFQC